MGSKSSKKKIKKPSILSVLTIGNSMAGKTALIHRFTDNFFEDGSFYVVESSRGNVEIDFKNPSQGTLKSFFEDMKNKYNAIDIIN